MTLKAELEASVEQVIVEVTRATPVEPVSTMPAACMVLRRVRLRQRYRSLDGAREILVFEAPDAELVRQLLEPLREPGAELRVWTASSG